VPGLGTSFGRGGATTAQWELANADCIVIMGSSMAEAHPVAFRFVMQAKEKGATVIHVDPRFSRTSALASLHVPIRAGSDIAFLGGLINYVLQHDLHFKEYVRAYTNAALLVRGDYRDTEELGGIFSGLRPDGSYDPSTWQYDGTELPETMRSQLRATEAFSEQVAHAAQAPRDETLEDPRCVFQITKRHYARYTPDLVERVCGVPSELFVRVARAITENSGRERTTAFCYAVGWTQHTTGVQMIRACSILQSLLGNIGRPGGGILALRGHATIQGSTDIPTLYDLLPGYLPMPNAAKPHATLADYIRTERPDAGQWHEMPRYIASLLRAWYGERATRENDFCFAHLPQITGDHSQLPMTLAMADGRIRGLFVMGQNPATGGHNTRLVRRALANLDWLVVRDFFETDTAAFWYASPEVERGELAPATIKTEVFLIPAAATAEKDGSYTNTHRLVQFHHKAVEPPGDARTETHFVYHLGRRIKTLYADSNDAKDAPIRDLALDYPTHGPHDEPSIEAILKEINGFATRTGDPVSSFDDLKDDGTTACGCWIYSGVYAGGRNVAASREPDAPDGHGTHLGWGFAWPRNRRVLYNRASADPDGRPWSERKRYVWWDEAAHRWSGKDVPDFPADKSPRYQPPPDAKGMSAHAGTAPFSMNAEGLARLFTPAGVVDGPLPTHYEPVESPLPSALHPERSRNPVFKSWEREGNRYHAVGDARYPYVLTTFRLTEQHCAGLMSRALPWLTELQPETFVEIGADLARTKRIGNGDRVIVTTARGEIVVKALVTDRMRPLRMGSTLVHQVAMPWHFGYMGLVRSASANDLVAIVGDPNTSIHEGKVLTCDLRRA
jgi:formate dehydrogenase major subunit